MEFRCRLRHPQWGNRGRSRRRRERERGSATNSRRKALYVLAIQRAGRAALGSLSSQRRSRVSTREFLVFNQELATLLKAGMPLVQSLDILRQRVANPLLKGVLDDVV